jgi:acetylornithine deacetylase/succinyl-diaminopimelate desuccinylase-like protein
MAEVIEAEKLLAEVRRLWDDDVLPALEDYIRIPNLSPHFAPEWRAEGNMDRAAELLTGWCSARQIEGATVEVLRPDGLTPTIVVEIPSNSPGTGDEAGSGVFFYGHYDKQPEFTGWRDGLGPWEPVREGSRLYGRGAADDGYAVFAALSAIEALRAAGGHHARCLVVIEGSEESGSPDLGATLDLLRDRIGTPSLVLGLDSGCPTYDRLWRATSIRGLVSGTLTVRVLDEGIHSGDAGGLVPSSFRIARYLLSRVEDEATGEIVLDELRVPVPWSVVEDAKSVASALGDSVIRDYPTVEGLRLSGSDPADRIVRRTWEPALSVIGADGFPSTEAAGNVLRPFTSLQLSFRLPPTCSSESAAKAISDALTTDPPSGAEVTFELQGTADGWAAPSMKEWLVDALDTASVGSFGRKSASTGEGGSIPFMAMLGDRMPDAQIVLTGVLGPGSNAHGPNEFLDIDTAVKLVASIGVVLDIHSRLGSAEDGQKADEAD